MATSEEPKSGSGEDVGTSYRKAGPYLDASWQLIGSMVVFSGIGYWIGQKTGSRTWPILGGVLTGLVVGFYAFFKVILAIGKKSK